MITIIAKGIAAGVTQIAIELGNAIMGIGKMFKGIGNMLTASKITDGFKEMIAGILELITAIVKIISQIVKMTVEYAIIYTFWLCISEFFFYLTHAGTPTRPRLIKSIDSIDPPVVDAFYVLTIVSLFLKWWMV